MHYEAPKAELLEQEMKQFIDWFNTESNLDPILKALVAHLWFITIHPFDDGNVLPIPSWVSSINNLLSGV